MILEFQRHPNILFYGWLLSNSRLMLECSSKPLKVMEELGFMEDSYPALMPNSWSKKARRWPWRLQKVKTTLIQTKIAKALPSTMITSRALFQGEICTTKARNLVKDFGTFSQHRQNILSGSVFQINGTFCHYFHKNTKRTEVLRSIFKTNFKMGVGSSLYLDLTLKLKMCTD